MSTHIGPPPRPPTLHDLEEVIVDTRPIAVVLLSRSVRPFILAAGALAFILIARASPPAGLNDLAIRALAVFVLAVIYWITGVLPLMVTSLLVIVLLGLSGVMPARSAYALFGNEAVFFVMAAFMLAAAVSHRGLGRRVALLVFGRFGRTPQSLLLSVYLLSALMSFVIPEHAVAAMVFPIVLELATTMELQPGRSRYASALFLAMAWGVNIGGVATLLGGARGPLALGILNQATGRSISFFQWSVATMPLVILLLFIGFVVLRTFFPADVALFNPAALKAEAAALGRLTFEEKAVAAILAVTLFGWLYGSSLWGFAGIGIIAVVALFVLNLLTWNEVEEYVNWGIILMYGGAIALGGALQKSGAAGFIATITMAEIDSVLFVVAILTLASLLLGEALSHSAVVAALVPVALGLAGQFGMDPRSAMLAVTIPAGLTFILPLGTPANALAYSSGYLRRSDLVAPGLLMHLSAWIGLNIVAQFYWPLIGLNLSGH